jgi:hypothetical protein
MNKIKIPKIEFEGGSKLQTDRIFFQLLCFLYDDKNVHH